MKIAVIGAGGWGTALALQASKKNEVVLWSFLKEEADLFDSRRENVTYLPGVPIPPSIKITSDINAVNGADLLLFVPPSKFFRNVTKAFKGLVNNRTVLVSATKGLEYPTEKRMTEILAEEFPGCRNIAALSGPTHAEEVGRDIPTSIVAASKNEKVARIVQDAFSTDTLRVYTNNDCIGVEISAAVKNVIAVAAGVLRGLGYGDNTMAALITRGLAEIKRLGLRMGARESTFAGLAGVGDLIVTCISRHSRNGRVGEALAKGQKIDEILAGTKMVAEGVETVKSVVKYQHEHKIQMPISQGVYDVIYGGREPLEIMKELMTRPLKNEKI